jgi:putative hydrolase of the HAD superfamily
MREMGCSEECINAVGKGFINTPLWDELDLGIQPEEDALEAGCNAVPEYADEIRAMWENNIKAIRPYDYCVDFVKGLKDKGFKVFLLTNYPVKLFDESVATSFPFYDLIDGKVVSSHINIIKPSEGIYKALFEKYDLKAEECVFFDDRQRNVDAANRLGMHAFVFEGYEKALKDFEKATADNQ